MNRRAGGWGTPILLTLVAAACSIIGPGLLIFVPFALLLIALPPRRPALLAVAVALLFVGISGGSTDMLWWFGRGWALILGAWFVVTIALMPRTSFMDRSLTAVAATVATAALLLAVGQTSLEQLDFVVAQRLHQVAAAFAAALSARPDTTGRAAALSSEVAATASRAADLQAMVYPGLLAIASLAGLAVAFWAWRRLALHEERPFRALREFRFRDELVWVLVAAILLIVLPLDGGATRAGVNLIMFMGALYALRGIAVMVALFGAPGPLGVMFGAVLVLFLFPMVLATTLMIGLSDTWLDLRARARRSSTGA